MNKPILTFLIACALGCGVSFPEIPQSKNIQQTKGGTTNPPSNEEISQMQRLKIEYLAENPELFTRSYGDGYFVLKMRFNSGYERGSDEFNYEKKTVEGNFRSHGEVKVKVSGKHQIIKFAAYRNNETRGRRSRSSEFLCRVKRGNDGVIRLIVYKKLP